jgi:hypothetical protein
MFALNVTAFSADGACNDTKSVVTNVTAATRPTVDVQPPAGNTSVCINGNATAVLEFTVSSPDANATITLAEPAAQFCTAEPSTVCKYPGNWQRACVLHSIALCSRPARLLQACC